MDINTVLDRKEIENQIIRILEDFDTQCDNINYKKGIYIYGSPGCGKTEFIINILNKMNYNIVKYDAGDVRNKALIDSITSDHIGKYNVLELMKKTKKKIAIVMDEIDGMNNGDKGGITSLIKLIRQKKTKKQKNESKSLNPIICIGNYYIDKKIKELIKVCNTYQLKTPNTDQVSILLDYYVPTLIKDNELKEKIIEYIQGDLRKIFFIKKIYDKNPNIINKNTIQHLFHVKSYNEDAKNTTKHLINRYIPMKEHNVFMNETDRTTVALLWHENIVDLIEGMNNNKKTFPFYLKILEKMCFADYTDRITFQNQIWQFNEMSSLIKTFHNNKIYHETFPENKDTFQPLEVRFTKILTKYSTEYNNILFIYNLCQQLDMDKKDLIAFFQELRLFYGKEFTFSAEKMNKVEELFQNYDISKLDIKRMYRYLDKNVKKDIKTECDVDDDSDIE
jgi:hypothetical protein